jgi:response regulator RpfG family c-di-GMP phosphodiesterase
MRPPAKYTLLIVDDEPDVCDSVHDLLRREFRVLKAHSGAEGYRRRRGGAGAVGRR